MKKHSRSTRIAIVFVLALVAAAPAVWAAGPAADESPGIFTEALNHLWNRVWGFWEAVGAKVSEIGGVSDPLESAIEDVVGMPTPVGWTEAQDELDKPLTANYGPLGEPFGLETKRGVGMPDPFGWTEAQDELGEAGGEGPTAEFNGTHEPFGSD